MLTLAWAIGATVILVPTLLHLWAAEDKCIDLVLSQARADNTVNLLLARNARLERDLNIATSRSVVVPLFPMDETTENWGGAS